MSEESSFEIINRKSDELEALKNDIVQRTNMKSASLVSSPPSDLPNFITVSSYPTPGPSGVTYPAGAKSDNSDPQSKSDSEKSPEGNDGSLGSSIFGWVKDTVGTTGTSLLSKVAEKAKSSVDSVITTLDPQMRDFIPNNGGVEIIVASDKEIEVSPIREAFQQTFSRSSVRGLETDTIEVAKQIVGFDSASQASTLRVDSIRNQHPVNCPIIAVQSFIAEISEDKWYDLDLLVLHDLEKGLQLETYSQMIPIPTSIINLAREDTEKDYKYSKSGFSVTVSHIMGNNLQVHPSEWHETLTGVSRRSRILFAAKVLANLYKNTLL
ncbi:protein PRRC1-like [Planococcus citri]|uniref:protein PRRC1-like n=1 Tax=Planococcus citri TaxID=170843 RepID=UPI0031F96896